MSHPLRVGVGGWTFEPWRDNFYPANWPHKRELEYASRKLTAIEINGTFYRAQTADTYRKWAGDTPDGFQFTVKAHRYATSRKAADEFAPAIDFFLNSGVCALGDRLGAINWQFPPHRRFDPDYFQAFFAALPPERDGVRLRHAIEVRHRSFQTPAFRDLLEQRGLALVFSDEPDWPTSDWPTADFAYARLQCSREDEPLGYAEAELDQWAATLRAWAQTRAVYAFFISGAKPRDPAAAMALIERAHR